MTPPLWRLVTVDIDGTLTTVHGWRWLADAFGRREEYDRTQRRFMGREIGEDQHLEEMLRLAEGRSLVEVEAALASTPRISGIKDGIRDLHAYGSRVALLTHNPPYVCEWYQRAFGFDDFEGSSGQRVVDGIVQTPQGVRVDKPAGLRALSGRLGVSYRQVVHIGDGWADARLFPLAGRGIALNSTLPEVARAADLSLRANDFHEVVRAVEALGPRP
jgi:phosphoserine phosphatase